MFLVVKTALTTQRYASTTIFNDWTKFGIQGGYWYTNTSTKYLSVAHSTAIQFAKQYAPNYIRLTYNMMTSSDGNFFRVTGPLRGEFTGPGEFPTQRPVTRNFGVSFDLRLNKRLSKQPWGWWFETPSWSLWRQCNDSNRLWCNICVFSRGIPVMQWCVNKWVVFDIVLCEIYSRCLISCLWIQMFNRTDSHDSCVRVWFLYELTFTALPPHYRVTTVSVLSYV